MTPQADEGRAARLLEREVLMRGHQMKALCAGLFAAWMLSLGAASAQEAAGVSIAAPVTPNAEQETGAPGSPNATTTIDGRYLPPPDPRFGGQIDLNAAQSKPWWAPRVVPPKSAANLPLIKADDGRIARPSTFGGVI